MDDVIVLGSGPAGAIAAAELLEQGRSVHLVHLGHDDTIYRDLIPDAPFSTVRRDVADQSLWWLGADDEGIPTGKVRIGSQLTPPRQFTVRDTATELPVHGDSFEPMQSLALGGLGAAWGAAAYTYTADELAACGLPPQGFAGHYAAVAERIGVSGSHDDDTAGACSGQLRALQPPLDLDSNAQALLSAYRARGTAKRMRLGRMPLAILSQDLGDRRANPYFDMDFWSDVRKSIYRPRYTIEQLRTRAGFVETRGVLAVGFDEGQDGLVRLHGVLPDQGHGRVEFAARRLVVCAGALNSARLVLAARAQTDLRAPLLCNPYTYMPCLQLRRLGRPAQDRRHSMAQLTGLYAPPDAPDDLVSLQFYSYRSLLAFKLVKELPLHPWVGLQVVRLLMESLVIVGVHHSDAPTADNWLGVARPLGERAWPLRVHYQPPRQWVERRQQRERAIVAELWRLGCIGGARLRPGHASSIHYAGTIPHLSPGSENRHGLDPHGRLLGTRGVYVADSAGWGHLPAKGLTLTIMANARRIALAAAVSLEAA